jgi:hypothetical protein
MNATEFIIQQIPLSEAAVEYAERYCAFYDNATYDIGPEAVVITHRVTIDPTESVFWPGNQIC